MTRVLALAALPAAIALFCVLGPFTTDPLLIFSGLAPDWRPTLDGFGTADPNMGITADALGRRAARDLLSGTLPLWDHLQGLGAPLLGAMQPAALFPPTLLLLLPHGQVFEQTFLQFVAGAGTYLLLRRLGLGTAAALAGGILFELNGVFALLRNAVCNPVAFLPWLLYAVESLRATAASWRASLPFIGLAALAAALALYAGFPEVVYLYALLIVLWTVLRALSLPLAQAARMLASLAAGALLALVIAAPLLLAFAAFLPEAVVGFHQGDMAQESLLPTSLILVFLPWIYGAIAGAPITEAAVPWNGIGGYLGLLPTLLAFAGLVTFWRRPLSWLLAAWTVLCIAASHRAPIVFDLALRFPGVRLTLFFRYLDAGWILCIDILAACFLDRLPTLSRAHWRAARLCALAGTAATLAIALALAAANLAALWHLKVPRRYEIVYLLATLALTAAFLLLRSRRSLAALAIAEATATFLFPLAALPRARRLDRPLIAFMQEHVGLARMASAATKAFTPNYPSALGFASVNYDELPVPARTAAFVRANLDPAAIPWAFWPNADGSHAADELRATARTHLDGYRAAAVRYLVGPPDLFASPDAPRRVFDGTVASVFELPGATGYAAAPGCRLDASSRDEFALACDAPARLIRREVYMSGWTARINGDPVPLTPADDTFQAVDVPAGASTLTFRYEPAYVRPSLAPALAALLLALALLASARFPRLPREETP